MREERVERLFGLMFSWFSGYELPLVGVLTNYIHDVHISNNGIHTTVYVHVRVPFVQKRVD